MALGGAELGVEESKRRVGVGLRFEESIVEVLVLCKFRFSGGTVGLFILGREGGIQVGGCVRSNARSDLGGRAVAGR